MTATAQSAYRSVAIRRRTRDGAYLTVGLVVLAAAVFGLISAGALVAGSPMGSSGNPKGPRAGMPAAISAAATATAVVRIGRVTALRNQALILRRARTEAARIISAARHRSRPQATEVPPPTPEPTQPPPAPTPVPVPTSTSVITGAPSLKGVPASWSIYVFGANVPARTVHVLNRSSSALSGTVLIFYRLAHGGSAVRRARFSDVAGRTVAVISMPGPPARWMTYRLGVTGIS